MDDSKLLEIMIKSKKITALEIKSFFQLNKEETIELLICFLDKGIDKFDQANPSHNKYLFYARDMLDDFYTTLSNDKNTGLPYFQKFKMLKQDLYDLAHYCKGTSKNNFKSTFGEELYLEIYYYKNRNRIEEILATNIINLIDDYQLVDNIINSYLKSLHNDKNEYDYYKEIIELMIYNSYAPPDLLFYISHYIEENLQSVMENYPKRNVDRLRNTEKWLSDIHENLVNIYRNFDVSSKKKPTVERPYIFTIDENTTYIREDALSIDKVGDDTYVTVYIIDPCDKIFKNEQLLNEAIYHWFDCDNNHLLDIEYCKRHFSLDSQKYRKVIAFEYCIDNNKKIKQLNIYEDKIRVNKNYTYTEITEILNEYNLNKPPIHYIKELYEIIIKLHDNNIYKKKYHLLKQLHYYLNNDPKYKKYKNKNGYMIVSELKILTNSSIANLLSKAMLPCIYRNNQFDVSDEQLDRIEEKCNISDNEKELYSCINNLNIESWYSEENIGHYGLHLDAYIHATTPVRNFFALLNLKILKDMVINKRFDKIDFYKDLIDELMQKQSVKVKGRKNGKIKQKEMENIYEEKCKKL